MLATGILTTVRTMVDKYRYVQFPLIGLLFWSYCRFSRVSEAAKRKSENLKQIFCRLDAILLAQPTMSIKALMDFDMAQAQTFTVMS